MSEETRVKGLSNRGETVEVKVNPHVGAKTDAAIYTGSPVVVVNGGQANLPFTVLAAGTDLLDRSDPENPTVLADGIYLLFADAACTDGPLTADGYVQLTGNVGGYLPESVGGTFNNPTDRPEGHWSAASGGKLVAGDTINVLVVNRDGAVSRHFSLGPTTLVKIS